MVTIRNHNVILDAQFTSKLNSKVIYELGKMCAENQLKFKELYSEKKRSLLLAYICLVFFPSTHYAFLGRWQMQGLYWLTLGGGLVWWIVDLFRLPKLVSQTNFHFQQKILRDINSISVFKPVSPIRIPSIARVA
ncbi:MAG: TM2 domain-containing protein [Bacteroidia bacterium]